MKRKKQVIGLVVLGLFSMTLVFVQNSFIAPAQPNSPASSSLSAPSGISSASPASFETSRGFWTEAGGVDWFSAGTRTRLESTAFHRAQTLGCNASVGRFLAFARRSKGGLGGMLSVLSGVAELAEITGRILVHDRTWPDPYTVGKPCDSWSGAPPNGVPLFSYDRFFEPISSCWPDVREYSDVRWTWNLVRNPFNQTQRILRSGGVPWTTFSPRSVNDGAPEKICWVMRLNDATRREIASVIGRSAAADGVTKGVLLRDDFLAVHIRRGDKHREMTLKGYWQFADEIASLSRNAFQDRLRDVFVMSDDPGARASLFKALGPAWSVASLQVPRAPEGFHESAPVAHDCAAALGLFADLAVLTRAKGLVLTLNSNPSRLALAICKCDGKPTVIVDTGSAKGGGWWNDVAQCDYFSPSTRSWLDSWNVSVRQSSPCVPGERLVVYARRNPCGLGSQISVSAGVLAMAARMGRRLAHDRLWADPYTKGNPFCGAEHTLDCFFEPMSACEVPVSQYSSVTSLEHEVHQANSSAMLLRVKGQPGQNFPTRYSREDTWIRSVCRVARMNNRTRMHVQWILGNATAESAVDTETRSVLRDDRFIAMHLRAGDKAIEMKLMDTEYYARILRNLSVHLRDSVPGGPVRDVFLMTDDEAKRANLSQALGKQWRVAMLPVRHRTGGFRNDGKPGHDVDGALGLLADMVVASRAKAIGLALASNVSRVLLAILQCNGKNIPWIDSALPPDPNDLPQNKKKLK